jgi:hypothetical protein
MEQAASVLVQITPFFRNSRRGNLNERIIKLSHSNQIRLVLQGSFLKKAE